MDIVLFLKFSQHQRLQLELLSTGDAELIKVQFLHHHGMFTRLTSEEYRTRIKIPSGGVGQMGRVGMSLGKLLCGFASLLEQN